jgi:VanZ family protein
MSARPLLRYWLPVIIWMAIIFIGSTDLLSAEQTSRIIGPLLRWLKPDISPETIAQVQFFVRKGAHLTEYAVLATLLWRALRFGTRLQWKMSIVAGTVLFVCVLFAASDEFHQSFVASRTASASDVLIDIAGALIALAFCWRLAARAPQRARGARALPRSKITRANSPTSLD